MYCGCPVYWQSKLQTEIALSTTESEYIAMSSATRQLIPCMNILKELEVVIGLPYQKPVVKGKQFSNVDKGIDCVIYEDNQGCIATAKCQKMTPRTKHIALKYHHFRSYVEKNIIGIVSISTDDQTSDILTKPLEENAFLRHRKTLCGY